MKRMLAPPARPGDRTLQLVVGKSWGLFDCAALPHFALALARLDVRVVVDDGGGPAILKRGRVTQAQPVAPMLHNPCEGARPGEPATFRLSGDDVDEAVDIVEAVFSAGRGAHHLSVLRLYDRYRKATNEHERLAVLEEHEALRAVRRASREEAIIPPRAKRLLGGP